MAGRTCEPEDISHPGSRLLAGNMDRGTVLVVDDNEKTVELFAAFLDGEYGVRRATRGEEALGLLDDGVDVVLLDRRMPGMPGDEILDQMRAGGFDGPVIMTTAVAPDVDIVRMSFNEYLTKPITREELLGAVDRVLELSDRDVQVQEYFSLLDKQLALEDELGLGGILGNDEYHRLEARLQELTDRMDPPLTEEEEQLAQRLVGKWPEAGREPENL